MRPGCLPGPSLRTDLTQDHAIGPMLAEYYCVPGTKRGLHVTFPTQPRSSRGAGQHCVLLILEVGEAACMGAHTSQ